MIYGEGETPITVGDNGQVIITRSEAEVFSPETIASFQGKAVTITHPEDFVSPENWSVLAKGVLQNVRRGEGDQKNDLVADILITDSLAINLVKSGLREVSCGYEAEYTETEPGRGIQTKIIGNHLALVQRGRAGSSYAINDHQSKGKVEMLKSKIQSIFAKAQDEALKLADADAEIEKEKIEKEKSTDLKAYMDELTKQFKDLGEKIAGLTKVEGKDEEIEKEKIEKEKEIKDMEVNGALEERLKILEAAVQKLLEKQTVESESDDEEIEVVADEEEIEDEEVEKEKIEKEKEYKDKAKDKNLVGDQDTISRAEILAPGIEMTKDVKVQALKTAYATKEGKKTIDTLTGGKTPSYGSKEVVDSLFIAAAELLKQSRSEAIVNSKRAKDAAAAKDSSVMTAEKLNEMNQKFYNKGV